MEKKKLLLHSCCGPCSTAVIEKLMEDGKYSVTVFYYNPNIDDREEYEHRKSEQIRFIKEYSARLADEASASNDSAGSVDFVEGPYDPENYLAACAGLEACPEGGERCSVCFRLRLSETVKYAKDHGYDCFDTTLTVSPYKNYDVISAIGRELAEEESLEYLCGNYKKKNGYGLYRQHFCGCSFSKREAGPG